MAYRKGSGKTGRKNMKRVKGGWQNQHGVVFTDAERKALNRAVAKSNRQRKKALEAERGKPHIAGGKVVSKDKSQLLLMGKESPFIVSQQSSSMQKFKSKEDFEKYLDKQERIHSGEYYREKARLYKRNFMNSLRDTYGDDAKDIINKVRRMNPEKYMEMVANDETLEISFVPSDDVVAGRLNQLREALGMEQKDEWPNEEYDV